MTTNETISLKEHITEVIRGSQELTKQQFIQINERLDTVQASLEHRQDAVDTEFTDVHLDIKEIKLQVEALNIRLAKWGGIIAAIWIVGSPLLYELLKHLNFGS
jgi:hypothetical protein